MRWQQGLVEATMAHRRQVLEASTTVGRSALPFLAVFELLAPIVELVGVVGIVVAALLGLLGVGAAAALLALAVSIGVLLGAIGMLLEQSIGGQLVARPRDAVVLIVAALLEQFGPRQQVAWWRLRALMTLGRRTTPSWDGMHHRGAGSVATVVDGRAVR
jgi:hypothetical protein